MRLDEYLEEFGTSIPKLAKKANLSELTVRNIVNEKKDPLLSTCLKLEAATKGQVTCRELLPKTMLRLLQEPLSQKKALGDSRKPLEEKNKQKKNKNNKKL
jgi:DNA-binding XRE family transcriptional regulator